MKFLTKVTVSLLILLMLFSVSASAKLQKPYVDKGEGYSIALPSRWESQPVPPPTDYESLGVSRWLMELFTNGSLTPLLIYKGPQFDDFENPPEFQLYKVKAESYEEALKIVKNYAKSDNLGRPREETKFKLKCRKSKKCTRLKFMWSGYGDQWIAFYFLVENDNGIFLYRYEYWATYKHLEKKVMESAKSFRFIKKVEKKKGEENLPPGWKVLETDAYLIQYNEPNVSKVKKYASLLTKLHKYHVKLLPPKAENEKYRPEAIKKNKFVIKYFKDEKGFSGYAGDNGVFGAAAYYSPGQNEIAFYDTGWSKESLAILYHECTHQYLHDFVGGPRVDFHIWINEGLAEYFFAAGMAESGKIKLNNVHSSALNSVKKAIRGNAELKVNDLIVMSQGEYYQIGRFAYDHGWALTHFLLNSNDKKYQEVVRKYFYTMQAITFPLLDRLAKMGEDLTEGIEEDGIDFGDLEDIEDLEDLEDELDELDEKQKERKKKREERESILEQLEDAKNVAKDKAFEGIDIDKLHKDFVNEYK